jgi:hypothetical protein
MSRHEIDFSRSGKPTDKRQGGKLQWLLAAGVPEPALVLVFRGCQVQD